MNVDGNAYRSIWVNADGCSIDVIDQTRLPHEFKILNLNDLTLVCDAIRDMVVRGAPLIGVTAAYGLALALRHDPSDQSIENACQKLLQTRPTAINLGWALTRTRSLVTSLPPSQRFAAAFTEAGKIADEDVHANQRIAAHGLKLIRAIAATKQPDQAINILTHCNAGWLATVDWGTATAPMYLAHNEGIPLHIWVDETRPRNQGASLTAWELGHHGIDHSLIVDNLGGHLMQHGMVDLCLVGSDRTTSSGDVCNKIGTYLKALAAKDNDVPFYACLPSSTIDWNLRDGIGEIPIEQRDSREVSHISGKLSDSSIDKISITPAKTKSINYAFDVTPARLITGLITERGITPPTNNGLKQTFPDQT